MRNLKTMGLALVAIFAMSGMGAAAALADHPADFWAEQGTVQIDVEADGHHVYSIGPKVVTCEILDGHAAYSEETDTLTGTDAGLTACKTTIAGFIVLATTLETTPGCHDTFTAGTYTTTSDDAEGSVHICGFTITQYTNESHTNVHCKTHVPAQTVAGYTYSNALRNGTEAVTVAVDAEVAMTVTDFNKFACNSHEAVNASYSGNFWAYGTNLFKEVTDTAVTPTP